MAPGTYPVARPDGRCVSMHIFYLARRQSHWLRVALAGLLLVFALDSVAHTGHAHGAEKTPVEHTVACGYCATFGALTETSSVGGYVPSVRYGDAVPFVSFNNAIDRRPAHRARPRAPPLS